MLHKMPKLRVEIELVIGKLLNTELIYHWQTNKPQKRRRLLMK
jgi:hypothetical protein